MTNVQVPERGPQDVSRDAWNSLRVSPDFWSLVEAKVLSVSVLSNGGARLHGSAFVGSAICDDVRIDCVEKVPGALAALLSHGTPGIRVEPVQGPTTDTGSLIRLLVDSFLDHVQGYVSDGRDWFYSTRVEVSPLVGGRLRVTDTVTLRARGLRHRVAFDRPIVERVTPTNRLILAALREVETLASLSLVGAEQLAGARAMAAWFADCLGADVLFGSSQGFIASVPVLMSKARTTRVGEMISIAGALLAHAGMDRGASQTGSAPLAWFVNLETLFESTVRNLLAATVSPGLTVLKGGRGTKVFPDTGRLNADPDLIVSGPSSVEAIGDVKYKVWSSAADAGDLYQLLVHSAAFGANSAFLVYPSDSFAERALGPAVTGATTRLFAVDLLNLGQDVERMANALGLTTTLDAIGA